MQKNYKNHKNHSPRRGTKPLSGTLSVTAEECGGNVDKMIRRFIKKEKNEGIVEEFRSRSHYIKPSEIKREKGRQRKRMIEKVNKQRAELFKPRGQRLKGSRSRRK